MKLKDACSLEESYDQPRQHIKKQRYYFASKGLSSQSYGFSSSHVWMWDLDYKESWALRNCCFWTVVLEKTLESPLDCEESQPVHSKKSVLNIQWKNWCWSWNSNPLATWCEELTHWKRPWCWEGLKVGGEGDDRRWDGWMASPTWWTWVWGGSGGWWWTGKPGVLRFMGSELDTTEWLNWTELTSPGTFLPSRRAWSAPTAALQIPFSWSLSGQISLPWQNFSLENEYKMQLVEKSVL